MSASIVGKALPDVPYTVVSTPTTKSTVAKLQVKGKTLVLSVVDDSSPAESKAAVQLMEDNVRLPASRRPRGASLTSIH